MRTPGSPRRGSRWRSAHLAGGQRTPARARRYHTRRGADHAAGRMLSAAARRWMWEPTTPAGCACAPVAQAGAATGGRGGVGPADGSRQRAAIVARSDLTDVGERTPAVVCCCSPAACRGKAKGSRLHGIRPRSALVQAQHNERRRFTRAAARAVHACPLTVRLTALATWCAPTRRRGPRRAAAGGRTHLLKPTSLSRRFRRIFAHSRATAFQGFKCGHPL